MKRILAALAALFCLSSLLPAVFAQPAAEIPETSFSSVELSWSVNHRGKAEAEETYVLHLQEPHDRLTFPLPENASGVEVPGYSSKLRTVDGVPTVVLSNQEAFTGELTVRLFFTVKENVSAAETGLNLHLPLLRSMDYPIDKLSLTVTLPEDASLQPVFSSGYAGALVDDTMEITTDNTTITASMLTPLRDHETLSLSVLLPKEYFSGSFGDSPVLLILGILAGVLALGALLYWWRLLRNHSLRVQARTLPPDGVNPGDVPYLLSGGHADFSLLVSHWATLGYLSFYVNREGHVVLRRRMSMGNERRQFERRLFDLLFDREGYCDGASRRYRQVAETAMAVIPRYWNKRLYTRESGSPFVARALGCLSCGLVTVIAMDPIAPQVLHGLFLLLALITGFALSWMMQSAIGSYYLNNLPMLAAGAGAGLLLVILGILGDSFLLMLPVTAVSFFLGWQTCHGGKRAPYGDEVIAQTMGFRRFLLHASDRHLSQTLYRDPQYFYKMLPFAEAMGQGKRLAALLTDRELEPCQWYETAGKAPVTAGEFYLHYNETLTMLRTSIRQR